MQILSAFQLALQPQQLVEASKVRLQIMDSSQALYIHCARAIADEIQANNQAGQPTRLILPVGPVHHYPELVRICNHERISWRQVYTFNMDEYCDWQGRAVPTEHPLSFRGFMQRVVFDQLNPELRIPADQIHFPDPLRLDEIEARIVELGGIDSCYGGIGYHGHVAFNEPPVSRWYAISPEEMRNSLTRVIQLAPESIVMNSIRNAGGASTQFPPMGVTLGLRAILSARRIRLYCDGGEWQRHILRVACLGQEDVDYPVTLLQGHPDYILIADRNTASPVLAGLGY